MLIGLAGFHKFRPKQCIAIEENGGQPHEHALLLADFADGVLDDLEVVVGFLSRGRAESQLFEKVTHRSTQALVGDARFLHQIVDGRHRTDDLGAVNDRNRQAAEITRRLDLIVSLGVVGDLFRIGYAQWTVGHVAQNVFCLA